MESRLLYLPVAVQRTRTTVLRSGQSDLVVPELRREQKIKGFYIQKYLMHV